ncbi:hypothetical protein EI42_01774 [Thermosporothrix hazakensis]|uniref:Uncharacterized protein n=1 Tax=Thermosporothrix hazakensis TaxID=644383 RepID=A0A326UA59_THEHA|nr:hypothetical protein EI42_01774 [Thermosporothrix hazakensis]
MHIHRADEVSVSLKAASAACPLSSLGLVLLPTDRTLARCPSFGASEAHDVSGFGLMSKVVDITTIFPQRHPLILVSAIVLVADTMRIPDEESSNLLLNTEIDHLAGGLVPHVTDTAFSTTTLLVFGALQLLPSARIVLASGLLFRKLTQVLAPLPFEGADPSPSHDHGHCCVGGDSRQVDFPPDRRWPAPCLELLLLAAVRHRHAAQSHCSKPGYMHHCFQAGREAGPGKGAPCPLAAPHAHAHARRPEQAI